MVPSLKVSKPDKLESRNSINSKFSLTIIQSFYSKFAHPILKAP